MAEFTADAVKKDAHALKNDGNCSFKKGDFEGAIAKYEECIHAGFSEKWILFSNMGMCYKKLEKFDDAIVRYNMALQEKPDFTKALYNRALCYYFAVLENRMDTKYGMLFSTEERRRLMEAYIVLIKHADEVTIPDEKVKRKEISNIISDYLGAKLAWITIDAKQTEDGAVKIMEMQDGLNSGYNEYDIANDGRKMDSRAEMKIKELVTSVVWSPYQENSHSSISFPWLDEYERSPPTSDSIGDLGDYTTCTNRSIGLDIRQGDMTLGNNAVYQMATMDKLVFHELLDKSGLDKACRPRSKKYKKPKRGHGEKTCNQIWKDFDGKKIITKIPDSEGSGQGVKAFVSKKDLYDYLNEGLQENPEILSSNPEFIVEEYLCSLVDIEGGPKDVTIRASFIVGYSNAEVSLYPLDAYYRIPLADGKGPSDGIVKGTSSFGRMPDDRKTLLFNSLEEHKAVFGYLLSTSLKDVRSHISLPDIEFQRRSAQAFSSIGQYDRARKALREKPSIGYERFQYYYAMAKIEYYAGNFEGALSHLKDADQGDPLTWKLSAFCFKRNGDLEKALKHLQNYKSLCNAYMCGVYTYLGYDLQWLSERIASGSPAR